MRNSIKKSNVQAIPDDYWLLTVKNGPIVMFLGVILGLYLSLLHTLCKKDNNTPSTFFHHYSGSMHCIFTLLPDKSGKEQELSTGLEINIWLMLWKVFFFLLNAISCFFLMKTNSSILMSNFDIRIFHNWYY